MNTNKLNILFFGIILGLIIMVVGERSQSIALFIGAGMAMICLAACLILSMRMLFAALDGNVKVSNEEHLRYSKKSIWWISAFLVLIIAHIILLLIDDGTVYEGITPFLRLTMSALTSLVQSVGCYYAICSRYGKKQLDAVDKNLKLMFFASEFLFIMLIQP